MYSLYAPLLLLHQLSLFLFSNNTQHSNELTCSLLKIHCFLLRWYSPTPPSLNSVRTQTLGIMMPFLSLVRSIIWLCLSLLGQAALRALVVQRTWKPVSFRTIFSIGVGLDTVQTLSIPFSASKRRRLSHYQIYVLREKYNYDKSIHFCTDIRSISIHIQEIMLQT